MKKRGRVLWLVYLNSTVPKSRGRIVAKNLAVPKPDPQEIAKVLGELGYKYEYRDKRYPPLWYDERGRGMFLIYADVPIRDLAKRIAEALRECTQCSS